MGLFDWWDDWQRGLLADDDEDMFESIGSTCSIEPGLDSDPDAASNLIGSEDNGTVINPATGLPMVGGIGGLDVAGNPYGVADEDDDLSRPFDGDL